MQELEAVQSRKVQIQEDQFRLQLLDLLQAYDSIVGAGDVPASGFQAERQSVVQVRVVFDDERGREALVTPGERELLVHGLGDQGRLEVRVLRQDHEFPHASSVATASLSCSAMLGSLWAASRGNSITSAVPPSRDSDRMQPPMDSMHVREMAKPTPRPPAIDPR